MYIISIPSYQRASLLSGQTLSTLKANGIPKELINIFIVQEDYDTYNKTLDPTMYNQLIIGVKGIIQQRKFIEDYYPEGQHIVSLDDDIQCIDLSLTKYTSLHNFFMEAFELCLQNKIHLWGVYPVFNPFFRKRDLEGGLQFIVGAFYGIINKHGIVPSLESRGKEDIERSILHYKRDGGVIRFGKVGFKTKYYGTGGLGNFKSRIEDGRLATLYFEKTYPECGKAWVRKNGMCEFRFKNKLKHPVRIDLTFNDFILQKN